MKNSKILMIIGLMLAQGRVIAPIYLWEMQDEAGRSCCLHIQNIDICNPYKPCTGFAKVDLSGILDYISRLLSTDQAKIEPHGTILVQIKRYIRSVLNNPGGTIGYKKEYRSVKFYHDIIDSATTKGKDAKKTDATATAKAKSDKDEFVQKHLMKLGLLKPWVEKKH